MDPFTIAAGIGAVGSLFKGLTGLFGGNAEAAAHEANAQQDLRQAGVNTDIALRQGDAVAATGAVRAAANGGGLVGSSMGVIQDLAGQAMFNARQQVYRGQTQAQSERYAGAVAKANGINQLIGGVIGAGASLVGGFKQSALFSQQNQAIASIRGLGGSAYDTQVPY